MIILVRHGETGPNRDGRLLGRADPPLTETGEAQVAALAPAVAALAPVAVVASPLRRAVQTAEAVASAVPGMRVSTDERLIEIDYGRYDGLSLGELPPEVMEGFRTDPRYAPPDGESLEDVATRMASFCEEWLAVEEPGPVVAVTHVSPIKAAVAWALDAPPTIAVRLHVGLASVTRIAGRPLHPVLVGFNERWSSGGPTRPRPE